MATRKATGRRTTRKTPQKGGSRRMGEGENLGKGQTRRTGARGTRTGGRRGAMMEPPREPEMQEVGARPDEERVGDFGLSDELEQGF